MSIIESDILHFPDLIAARSRADRTTIWNMLACNHCIINTNSNIYDNTFVCELFCLLLF